eukprot:TRINITY_DN3206_c0_g1_i5.p1 TRINITY_DN3206_c0_g1~~TRINITY_DN3206_c0_g1_i5.p1  ORF type:complete len:579 (+),score=85.79 TRINITY_DN3206_c0_g1_i5:108-1739(+)
MAGTRNFDAFLRRFVSVFLVVALVDKRARLACEGAIVPWQGTEDAETRIGKDGVGQKRHHHVLRGHALGGRALIQHRVPARARIMGAEDSELQRTQAAALKLVQEQTGQFFSELNTRFKKFRGENFSEAGAYKAYRESVQATQLAADAPRFKPRKEEGSILVSIAAYRDNELRKTLQDIVNKANHPEKIFVGLVQQWCSGKFDSCMSGVLAEDKVRETGPDEDTEHVFCSEERFREWCKTNMRVIKVEEMDSLGPTVARFVASKLWMGETYFMQIDAHMRLAQNWDARMVEQMNGAPSVKPILSTYPHVEQPGDFDEGAPGPRMCASYFAKEEGEILRLDASSPVESVPAARPVPTPWIAAGYFFAPGSFLEEVPFDPLSPWVFMGEELAITARAWTSGYDVFAPNTSLIEHRYGRRHLPKFWETVCRTFDNPSAHNLLQFYVLKRVKLLTGYSDYDKKLTPALLTQKDPDFLFGLDGGSISGGVGCGLGKKRSLSAFLQHVGVDMKRHSTSTPEYCSRAWPSHDDGSWARFTAKMEKQHEHV